MVSFIFYRKFDESKEPIDTGRFINLEEATQLFAHRKGLTVSQFKIMFMVKQKTRIH
jgi:hypothetical protein